MSRSVFVAQMARGTLAATAIFAADPSSVFASPNLNLTIEIASAVPSLHSRGAGSHAGITNVLSEPAPTEWSKYMETEFRNLALAEATRSLTAAEVRRLEQLNHWRDHLRNPLSSED